MKVPAHDQATAARAAAVARFGKRLDKDANNYAREVIGRGLAGWRVAHTDGSAAVLVRDDAAPPPARATGAFWAWVQAPAYELQAAPVAGALPAAVRFMVAASKGQHGPREAAAVAWSVVDARLTLHYVRPGWECQEAIAVVPLESVADMARPGELEPAATVTRGAIAAGYLAPLFDGVHVDGWTWRTGAIAGTRLIELGADGVRVVICELKAGK